VTATAAKGAFTLTTPIAMPLPFDLYHLQPSKVGEVNNTATPNLHYDHPGTFCYAKKHIAHPTHDDLLSLSHHGK